jgi:hypothetical protein
MSVSLRLLKKMWATDARAAASSLMASRCCVLGSGREGTNHLVHCVTSGAGRTTFHESKAFGTLRLRSAQEEGMPVLVRHNGKVYKIPDDVLARSSVSKERFEEGLRQLETAGERRTERAQASVSMRYRFLELSDDDFNEV